MQTRKRATRALLLAAAISITTAPLALAAKSVSLKDFKLAPRIARVLKSGKELQIYVSYPNVSNSFAPKLKAGVARASAADKVAGHFIGPTGTSVSRQIDQIEDVMGKMDGLAISSTSTDALAPIINRVLAAGIPVITFNTDNPKSKRLAFVGQNLTHSGEVAGKLMAKALHNKGEIIIATIDASAQWSLEREKGAREALAAHPKIKILQTVNTGTDPQQAYSAVENAMLAHPHVKGILALDCCSTPAAGTWVKRHHAAGRVSVVGFDLVPETVHLIKQGDIRDTIYQAPERQGFDAVNLLVQFLHGKPISNVDTGAQVYNRTNIDTVKHK